VAPAEGLLCVVHHSPTSTPHSGTSSTGAIAMVQVDPTARGMCDWNHARATRVTFTLKVHDVLDDATVAWRSNHGYRDAASHEAGSPGVAWNPQREIHASTSTESEPRHPGHRVAQSRPNRGMAVDANPDRPGRRLIAFGCAGPCLRRRWSRIDDNGTSRHCSR
jgi:hypothetical protein